MRWESAAARIGSVVALLAFGGVPEVGSASTTLLGQDLSQAVAPYDWINPPGNDIHWTTTYDTRKAVGLTIAAGPAYRLDSFIAVLQLMTDVGYSPSDTVEALLHVDAGGSPGAVAASLGSLVIDGPDESGRAYTFAPAAPVLLSAGSTYWLSLHDTSRIDGALPFVHWTVMQSRAAPTGAATLAGYRFTSDDGVTWNTSSRSNALQILATPVPEPRAATLLLAGCAVVTACAFARRRTRARSVV